MIEIGYKLSSTIWPVPWPLSRSLFSSVYDSLQRFREGPAAQRGWHRAVRQSASKPPVLKVNLTQGG
jgi:hypothetical protein